MKYFVSFFIVSLFTLCLFAQQHPSYTQYTLNRFSLNPAVAGLKPCSETMFGNRRQWVGFEGAPSLYFASFNTRLNHEDKYPKNFHGVGFQVYNDRHGFNNNGSVKIAYAYHIKLWTNYHLSIGMFAGIQRHSFSYSSVLIRNKAIDPAFDDEVIDDIVYPEISPGGFIYNRNFYLGLSMLQLFPARTGDLGTRKNRLTAHYFLSGGYRIRGRSLHYIPSFMMSFSPFISPTVDMTLTFDYKQIFIFGIGSKYLNSGYATMELRLFKKAYLGYSYEYAFNEINNVAPTTHEIILKLTSCIGDKKAEKYICPAYR